MKMPVSKLNHVTRTGAYEAEELDPVIVPAILKEYGVFVLRRYLRETVTSKYQRAYADYKASGHFDRNTSHLTEVRLADGNPLIGIIDEPEFRRVSAALFPGGAGVYKIRILKKDAEDTKPVFLHQDFGYEYGSIDRYSLFIPLTPCSVENGALTFIPGSHRFGYLGDAGAIRDSVVPSDLERLTPAVNPGDIVIMNTCTWHQSGANEARTERVYYDIRVNSAEDPACKYPLDEDHEREYRLDYDLDALFSNSRLQRLERYGRQYGPL